MGRRAKQTGLDTGLVPSDLQTVRLSAEGLGKVLGDLEARVMRTLWDFNAPTAARDVHARIAETHDVQYLTVLTVLNRLVRKRLARRMQQHNLLHYMAQSDERTFMADTSRRVVEGILSFGPDVAVSFVDVIAQDPERLAELERLIHDRMREQRPADHSGPRSINKRRHEDK
jgi:predicted transcriptional regulator